MWFWVLHRQTVPILFTSQDCCEDKIIKRKWEHAKPNASDYYRSHGAWGQEFQQGRGIVEVGDEIVVQDTKGGDAMH